MSDLDALKYEKYLLDFFAEDENTEVYKYSDLWDIAEKHIDDIVPILSKYGIFDSRDDKKETLKIKRENLFAALRSVDNKIQQIQISEAQRKMNKTIEKLSKDFGKLAKSSNKSFQANVLLVIGTFLLFLATVGMVFSNYDIMNQQMKSVAPQLKIWQPIEDDLPVFQKRKLVRIGGWETPFVLCIRNDGRSSTGAINIRSRIDDDPDDPDIDIKSGHIENLNPGEAKCPLVYISSISCSPEEPDKCIGKEEDVPTGHFKIPINITCLYCDDYVRTHIIQFRIK